MANFPPRESLVYTQRGEMPIELVVKNDMVLTHLGRWRSVLAVRTRQFEGSLISLTWQGGGKNLTAAKATPIATPMGWLFADSIEEKDGILGVRGIRPNPNLDEFPGDDHEAAWIMIKTLIRHLSKPVDYKGELWGLDIDGDRSFLCNRVLVHC